SGHRKRWSRLRQRSNRWRSGPRAGVDRHGAWWARSGALTPQGRCRQRWPLDDPIRSRSLTTNQHMKKQFVIIAFALPSCLAWLAADRLFNPMTIKDNKLKDDAAIRELMRRLCKSVSRQRH